MAFLITPATTRADFLETHDGKFEPWGGRLVPMNPVGHLHTRIVAQFGFLLQRHVRETHAGDVLIELGVKLRSAATG